MLVARPNTVFTVLFNLCNKKTSILWTITEVPGHKFIIERFHSGFYLGIFVWGEAQIREGRLVGGVWGFSPENFEFQIARDAI